MRGLGHYRGRGVSPRGRGRGGGHHSSPRNKDGSTRPRSGTGPMSSPPPTSSPPPADADGAKYSATRSPPPPSGSAPGDGAQQPYSASRAPPPPANAPSPQHRQARSPSSSDDWAAADRAPSPAVGIPRVFSATHAPPPPSSAPPPKASDAMAAAKLTGAGSFRLCGETASSDGSLAAAEFEGLTARLVGLQMGHGAFPGWLAGAAECGTDGGVGLQVLVRGGGWQGQGGSDASAGELCSIRLGGTCTWRFKGYNSSLNSGSKRLLLLQRVAGAAAAPAAGGARHGPGRGTSNRGRDELSIDLGKFGMRVRAGQGAGSQKHHVPKRLLSKLGRLVGRQHRQLEARCVCVGNDGVPGGTSVTIECVPSNCGGVAEAVEVAEMLLQGLRAFSEVAEIENEIADTLVDAGDLTASSAGTTLCEEFSMEGSGEEFTALTFSEPLVSDWSEPFVYEDSDEEGHAGTPRQESFRPTLQRQGTVAAILSGSSGEGFQNTLQRPATAANLTGSRDGFQKSLQRQGTAADLSLTGADALADQLVDDE